MRAGSREPLRNLGFCERRRPPQPSAETAPAHLANNRGSATEWVREGQAPTRPRPWTCVESGTARVAHDVSTGPQRKDRSRCDGDREPFRDIGYASGLGRRRTCGDRCLEQGPKASVAVGSRTPDDAVNCAPDHRRGAAVGEDAWRDPRTDRQTMHPRDCAGNEVERGSDLVLGRWHGGHGFRAELLGDRRPAARTRCVSSGTSRITSEATATGSVSHVRSSPRRPTTLGISGTSCWRSPSLRLSLTCRASCASRGCVQEGWSLHRSPARKDANSMKQAPRFGDRCLPRDRTGTPSGTLEDFIATSSIEDATAGAPGSRPVGKMSATTLPHVPDLAW